MESNLNIRGNVYIMPRDFSGIHNFPTHITNEHIKFIQKIMDKNTLDKISNNLVTQYATGFQQDNFGTCGAHPDRKMTYGQIKKGKRLVYSCRCDIKENCRFRIQTNQHCNRCSRSQG